MTLSPLKIVGTARVEAQAEDGLLLAPKIALQACGTEAGAQRGHLRPPPRQSRPVPAVCGSPRVLLPLSL